MKTQQKYRWKIEND